MLGPVIVRLEAYLTWKFNVADWPRLMQEGVALN